MKLSALLEADKFHSNGTFVGVQFDEKSCDMLCDLIKSISVINPVNRSKLHCTVMYSTRGIPEILDENEAETVLDPPIIVIPDKFHVFNTQEGDNSLVLLLKSQELVDRHNDILKKYDAKYPHGEYKPHVTLSYNCKDFAVDEINIPNDIKELNVISEHIRPINLNWV